MKDLHVKMEDVIKTSWKKHTSVWNTCVYIKDGRCEFAINSFKVTVSGWAGVLHKEVGVHTVRYRFHYFAMVCYGFLTI